MTAIEVLKLFLPSMLSALVAFMLFYKTTKRDRKKDEDKSMTESTNKVKHFNYVAKEAVKIVEKQAQALREHIVLLTVERFQPVPLGVYDKKSCEILVDLISTEGVFSAFTKVRLVSDKDVIETFSKVSAKGVYINHQLDHILDGAENNINYIHSQTKLIQGGIDDLLKAMNLLSISLQKDGYVVQEDKDFVDMTRVINKNLYSKEDQGLKTFYEHLVMAMQEVVMHCKVKVFSDIDGLLDVIRARDRAERMYNELFGSHNTYKLILAEEATKLQAECDSLKGLLALLMPIDTITTS